MDDAEDTFHEGSVIINDEVVELFSQDEQQFLIEEESRLGNSTEVSFLDQSVGDDYLTVGGVSEIPLFDDEQYHAYESSISDTTADIGDHASFLSQLNLQYPLYEGCPFSKGLFVAINFLLSISESTASVSLAIQCMGAFFPRSAGIERLKWSNLKRVIFRKAKQSPHAFSNILVCKSCGYLQPDSDQSVSVCTGESTTHKRKKPLLPLDCISCKSPVLPGYYLRIFPFVPQIRSIVESFPSQFSVSNISERLHANVGVRAGDTFFSPRFRSRFQEMKLKYKQAKYMAFAGLWHDGFGQSNMASSYRKNMWPVSFCFFNLPSYLRIKIPNICLLALIPGPSQPRFRWILKFLFEQIDYYNKTGGIEFIDEFGNKEKVIVVMATSSNDMPALRHAWELPISNIFYMHMISNFSINL